MTPFDRWLTDDEPYRGEDLLPVTHFMCDRCEQYHHEDDLTTEGTDSQVLCPSCLRRWLGL